jgi:Tfp pilus assembly ATPase PilU
MAALDIKPVLKFMVEKNGSDLFFSTGAAIHIELEGKTLPVNNQLMTLGMVKEIAYSLMSPEQIKECEDTLEMNFAMGGASQDFARHHHAPARFGASGGFDGLGKIHLAGRNDRLSQRE